MAKSKMAAYWSRSANAKRSPTTHYATPRKATAALLSRERFEGSILEPACGDGAIAGACRAAGYRVQASDIRTGRDFLQRKRPCDNIITNPPYHGTMATDFAAHALKLARRKVAFLLPIYFLEGVKRHKLFTRHRLKAVYVFSRRLTFNHGDKVPFGCVWLVWDQEYAGRPEIGWIL